MGGREGERGGGGGGGQRGGWVRGGRVREGGYEGKYGVEYV